VFGLKTLAVYSPFTGLFSLRASIPLSRRVEHRGRNGAHRADRVVVAGKWVGIDGAIPRFEAGRSDPLPPTAQLEDRISSLQPDKPSSLQPDKRR
jgi:hypothetical protein